MGIQVPFGLNINTGFNDAHAAPLGLYREGTPTFYTDAAPLGLCVWQFDFLMLNLQKRNANSMEEP